MTLNLVTNFIFQKSVFIFFIPWFIYQVLLSSLNMIPIFFEAAL